MGYWRYELLYSGSSLTLGSTDKFELPEHGVLSGLILNVSCDQQPANAGQDLWRIQDQISKIEIIANGHETITSLSGRQLHAMQFYDTGKAPYNVNRGYASNSQWTTFVVPFGRKLYDTEYGLNLDDFRSVDLKITNTMSATYWQDVAAVDVYGLFLEEAGASVFKGYLKRAEWESYTTAQDSWKYFDLPEQYPVRRIMIQCDPAVTSNEENTYFYNLAYEIQLMTRTGKVRLFDGYGADLVKVNTALHGHAELDGRAYLGSDTFLRTGVGRRTSIVFGDSVNTGAQPTEPVATDDGTKNTAMIYGAAGDEGAWYLARGEGIENTIVFEFTYPSDTADNYLDTVKEATVELNIHTRNSSSAANGINRIILEELVGR